MNPRMTGRHVRGRGEHYRRPQPGANPRRAPRGAAIATKAPDREPAHILVPVLEAIGFRLVIREPWWYGHRALVAEEPRCNLHVFGFDSKQQVVREIYHRAFVAAGLLEG